MQRSAVLNKTIPANMAYGDNVPTAWESSLRELAVNHVEIDSQYTKEGELPTIDSTMMIVVHKPMLQPRLHMCMPAGFEDLAEYVAEVVDGIKDHWVDTTDPAKWQYTYHGRLMAYGGPNYGAPDIDQITKMLDGLKDSPISRRCQGITWQPWCDQDSKDPPCLQRVWCRLSWDDDEQCYYLNMNTHWRSRDALDAAFMNMYAMTEWQRLMAQYLSGHMQQRVVPGRYVDISDSYHVYGRRREYFDHLMTRWSLQPFQARTVCSDDPTIVEIMAEGRVAAIEKVAAKDQEDGNA